MIAQHTRCNQLPQSAREGGGHLPDIARLRCTYPILRIRLHFRYDVPFGPLESAHACVRLAHGSFPSVEGRKGDDRTKNCYNRARAVLQPGLAIQWEISITNRRRDSTAHRGALPRHSMKVSQTPSEN